MDQFDRSPEDVSFDLDAEEYSLESILDEYKDFQTDAPAPRPQPAYRSRPVTAKRKRPRTLRPKTFSCPPSSTAH